MEYLQDRIEWAGEDTVRERMKSHLIDFELLSKATYKGLQEEQLISRLKPEFDAFLMDRAKLIHRAMTSLANGEAVSITGLHAISGL